MASSPSDNFAKMFLPEHPHRRLHILLSVLAFSVVVGSITLYQINKAVTPKIAVQPTQQKSEGLTTAQREKILSSLHEQAAKSPPISEAQREQIIENLKQALSQENK